MSILALPALYSPECVEGELCALRPNEVLRSSPKISRSSSFGRYEEGTSVATLGAVAPPESA
jgi:hypothetical protein